MIATGLNVLADESARLTAITAHDRTLLVEAGAGSGKTSVMAARVATMLANGVPPGSIAAVTFTELAGAELSLRVREYVEQLAAGEVPRELKLAFPQGPSAGQRDCLAQALEHIDELATGTIHSFCQRLITPYPVEAGIDPGAGVMDRGESENLFDEIVDAWLRERLSGGDAGLVAELVLANRYAAVELVHRVAKCLRGRRAVVARSPLCSRQLASEFSAAVDGFVRFLTSTGAVEPETSEMAARFGEMAAGLTGALLDDEPAAQVRLLATTAHTELCKADGDFRKYSGKKGKWAEAAKIAGLGKADGERFNLEAQDHYERCCAAWTRLLQNAATRVLAGLVAELRPVLATYQAQKRATAQLDFDDLIESARRLLRDHENVRRALAQQFQRVLVDEFQDTDPAQSEIFWRLCGEPPAGAATAAWIEFELRPGALFLVGDPKQAVYRFRGADVGAYIAAREAIRTTIGDDHVLSISVNFRSCRSILGYVNDRFGGVLSADGQPGFTPLDAFYEDAGEGPCVVALDVLAAGENGKASSEAKRDAEAEAVATMCAHLIGSRRIKDGAGTRLCQPGDIALLAPSGTDLWRYEAALEQRGIAVATQAGKGLFRRQEIQDLIALTRVLGDRRDSLALLALLRGPLVGLTEEQLLDIVWELPRSEAAPEKLPQLRLDIDAAQVSNELARDVLLKLQSLERSKHSTTPHELLSQAIDVLRVRPILRLRHREGAERALSNVDLYLSFARQYAVQGMRAFANAMRAVWEDEERAIEGRPDAEEDAVTLITMHSAKGLEWPIVVPINTGTELKHADSDVVDRLDECLYCPVLGVHPLGYAEVRAAEQAELERERARLWYVAATRARELLVLPRLDVAAPKSWIAVLDLALDDLPAIDLEPFAAGFDQAPPDLANDQTREVFASQAQQIANGKTRLRWQSPSQHDGEATGAGSQPDDLGLVVQNEGGDAPAARPAIRGGRERGAILHKLIEEALTGEVLDTAEALEIRALELIAELGLEAKLNSADGLVGAELASCVRRALFCAEVSSLRGQLLPEVCVYDLIAGEEDIIVAGAVDALAIDDSGRPIAVIDWKSDVSPEPSTIDQYRAQVQAYLRATGISTGLLVFATSGKVVPVQLDVAAPATQTGKIDA